jgi:hypothetical protein
MAKTKLIDYSSVDRIFDDIERHPSYSPPEEDFDSWMNGIRKFLAKKKITSLPDSIPYREAFEDELSPIQFYRQYKGLLKG